MYPEVLEVLGTSRSGNEERRENHPINCVDWEQARAYCVTESGRLPTEEEWEYAARGGSEQRVSPWGSDAPKLGLLNACGGECERALAPLGVRLRPIYPEDDGYPMTAPVGSFPKGAGKWGHTDLAGNVWQSTDIARLTTGTTRLAATRSARAAAPAGPST